MGRKRQWTERRRRALEAWIAETQPALRLQDWTIRVDWNGNELTHPCAGEHPSAFATMTPMPFSRHATMTVSRDLLDLPAEDQTQTLVHELVHCHLFGIHEFSLNAYEAAVDENALAVSMYRQGMVQQIELATDALADSLYRLLPPINLA